MPATAAFTSRGAYRVEGRVRGLRTGYSGMQMLFEIFKPSTEQEQGKLFLNGANQLIYAVRGSMPIIVDVRSDFLFRAQFDPVNSRTSLEVWNLDGTARRASADGLGDRTALNMGGAQLTLAAGYYNTFFSQCKMDWIRMLDAATPLNSAPPADSPPTGTGQLWRYEFENNGADSSGNNLTLTLDNSPLFETTPALVTGSSNLDGFEPRAKVKSFLPKSIWRGK
ncbi:MAG: hypothetical protein LC774_16620 [Acidobacteria bacterium]|nr:hypothetical protein [Acidobacteriota bacterium]